MKWTEVSGERYDEMLGMLPPAIYLTKGFLVGEPFDHRKCEVTGDVRPSFAAFLHLWGKFYSGGNMTIPEFEAIGYADAKRIAADAAPLSQVTPK